jgi:SAM-dependent methyltransferase
MQKPNFLDQEFLLNSLLDPFCDENYCKVEYTFINCSSYPEKIKKALEAEIKESSKSSFLDIGAGPALLTRSIGKAYEKSTVVEPNPKYESSYQNLGVEYFLDTFERVRLEDKYDFIFCSHMLYHVPQLEWPIVINKMDKLRKKGGRIAVTLVADHGPWYSFKKRFNKLTVHAGLLKNVLDNLNISYKTIPVTSSVRTRNPIQLKELVNVFAIGDNITPQMYASMTFEEKINLDQQLESIIEECKVRKNYYELVMEDECLVIS